MVSRIGTVVASASPSFLACHYGCRSGLDERQANAAVISHQIIARAAKYQGDIVCVFILLKILLEQRFVTATDTGPGPQMRVDGKSSTHNNIQGL